MTVRYKSATVAEFIENHSYDISRGGLFIKTTSPFPAGTLLKFEVRIANEQKVMMGVGRVAWRREEDRGSDKPAGMGVKFIKIDDEAVGLIETLVESRHDQPSSFEVGADDEGLRLSAPPEQLRKRELAHPKEGSEPGFFPTPDAGAAAGDSRDMSMLMQSSELLRAALEVTGTGGAAQPSAAEPSAAEDGDDWDSRATLPTGGTELAFLVQGSSEPSVEVEAAQDEAGAEDESDGDDDESEDEEETSATTSADPDGDSRRPASQRGAKRKKNPKKKKKKFKYASIPSAKPTAASPARVSDRPSSEKVTTPPRRATSEARSKTVGKQTGGSPVFMYLLVALGLVGVGAWFLLSQKPDSGVIPTAASAVVAEPTAEPTPTAEPEPTAEPTPTAEPEPTAEPTPTAEPEPTAEPTPTTKIPEAPANPVSPAPKPRPAPRPVAPKPPRPAPEAPAAPEPVAPAPVPPEAPVAPAPVVPAPTPIPEAPPSSPALPTPPAAPALPAAPVKPAEPVPPVPQPAAPTPPAAQ
jgi:uncharacterized protein (TIGR02266 family)